MTFSVDKFMHRQFHIQNYNCWDFIREVWLELAGRDIGHRTPEVATQLAMRRRFDREEREFVKLAAPEDPCIVLMRRVKGTPHVGIFYKKKVLSIDERGVTYFPLNVATAGFKSVGFYR